MNANTAGIRRKRNALCDRRSAIVQKAMTEKRPLTAAETAEEDTLAAVVASMNHTMALAEELACQTDAPQISVRDRAQDRPCGETFAACVLAVAGAALMRGDGRKITPEDYAKELLRDGYAAAALSASTLAAGGGLIRQDIAEDFIEVLRAKAVVRLAGAEEYPMVRGQLTIDGLSADPNVVWIGEQAGVNASAPTFTTVQLDAKKLRCTVPISNDLIRFAGQRVIDKVLKQIQLAVALAEDAAFLRGLGSYKPTGLSSKAAAKHASSASPTIATVTSETGQAINDLLTANSRLLAPCWFWHPRTGVFLRNQRSTLITGQTGLGPKVWPEIDERKEFRGYPFYETTSIPVNLGAGTDSEIYFQDAADIVIGQGGIQLRASEEAAYTDSSGAAASPFVRDETVIDIIEEVDLGVRHPGSLSFLSGVEYIP